MASTSPRGSKQWPNRAASASRQGCRRISLESWTSPSRISANGPCVISPVRSAIFRLTNPPAVPHLDGTARASLRALPRLKMGQRQRRAGLQRLDRNVASHLPDDGKFEQLGDEKLPIVLEIGNDHFQEVINLAGDEVKAHDFRHRKYRLLESQSLVVRVAFDLDADEDRKAQTDALSLPHGPIGVDEAVAFEALHPSKARRRGQANPSGEFDIA